jgi:hypothetical protein
MQSIYFRPAAESGAPPSVTVLDNSCNEYYSCAYTSGSFDIYAAIVIELTDNFFIRSTPFALYWGTAGTATISNDACTGVYVNIG